MIRAEEWSDAWTLGSRFAELPPRHYLCLRKKVSIIPSTIHLTIAIGDLFELDDGQI